MLGTGPILPRVVSGRWLRWPLFLDKGRDAKQTESTRLIDTATIPVSLIVWLPSDVRGVVWSSLAWGTVLAGEGGRSIEML